MSKKSILFVAFYSIISMTYSIFMLICKEDIVYKLIGTVILVFSMLVQCFSVYKKQCYDEYQSYMLYKKNTVNLFFLSLLVLMMFGFIFSAQYNINNIIFVFMFVHWFIMTLLELIFMFRIINN